MGAAKRSGIKIREVLRVGNIRWEVNVPASFLGKRRKVYRQTEAGAYAYADELEKTVRQFGLSGVENGAKKLAEVLARFWASRQLDGHHGRLARFFLDKFGAKYGALPIDAVSPFVLEEFWNSYGWKGTTKSQAFRYLSLFFGWAERYDLVARNPARRVERPKAEKPQKRILTPADMRKLLQTEDPIMLPFLCLGGFAGLRTSEFLAGPEIGRSEIHVREGKTGERFVKILPAFRRHWRKGEWHPPDERTFRRHRDKLTEAMGWEDWPDNCLRHSFASYHLAAWEDAPATAFQMGHRQNPRMLYDAYARAVTKAQARAWWAI